MFDPRLLASVPFRNPTAFQDMTGQLELYHRVLAQQIFTLTGNTYRTYPLDPGGTKEWLHAVQQEYANANRALGLPPPANLEDYDLSQPGDWASWCFTLSEATQALRIASGLS